MADISNDEFLARAGCAPPINEKQYEKWLETVRVRLDGLYILKVKSFSIFNVTSGQRKQTRDPYTPQIVCIGPLHRRENVGHYLLDDVDKFRYMLPFLNRFTDPAEALLKCAEKVKGLEEEARITYWKTIRLTKPEMMEMLLVDGCFLLELFIRYWNPEQREREPLFEAWVLEDLQHDLAILENQIPYNILQALFENLQRFGPRDQIFPTNLTSCVLLFFQPALNLGRIDAKLINFLTEKPIMHILDLIRNVYLSAFPEQPLSTLSEQPKHTVMQIDKTPNNPLRALGFRQSAKRLENGGIQFRVGDKDLLLHISFDKVKGVLTIPHMSINRITKSIFKNLIAFERCCPRSKHQIMSYIIFMRSLLNSAHDVQLLQQKGIIEKDTISGEYINFFKDLSAEVELGEFQFGWVCEQVNWYIKAQSCGQKIQVWARNFWYDTKVVLKEKYFKAAVVLLVLTIIQTVYTVISYYHRG